MPADGDIAELAEKAKLLAEASDRTEEDVMVDLLDDGVQTGVQTGVQLEY